MGTKKALWIAAATAFVGAFAPALLVLQMMADNNNQGELYDTVTGQWDVAYALAVAALFYVPSFVLIFAVAYVLARLCRGSTDIS